MSDPSPRYVLSADGFDIYDRWYCYEQVYTTPRYEVRPDTRRTRENPPAAHARTYRTLDTLNAAHEAWLTDSFPCLDGEGDVCGVCPACVESYDSARKGRGSR